MAKKARLEVGVSVAKDGECKIVSDWKCGCMPWREFPNGEPKGHSLTKQHTAWLSWKINFENEIRKNDSEIKTKLSNRIEELKSSLEFEKSRNNLDNSEELEAALQREERANKSVGIWKQAVARKDKEIKELWDVIIEDFPPLYREIDEFKKNEEIRKEKKEKKKKRKRADD